MNEKNKSLKILETDTFRGFINCNIFRNRISNLGRIPKGIDGKKKNEEGISQSKEPFTSPYLFFLLSFFFKDYLNNGSHLCMNG